MLKLYEPFREKKVFYSLVNSWDFYFESKKIFSLLFWIQKANTFWIWMKEETNSYQDEKENLNLN